MLLNSSQVTSGLLFCGDCLIMCFYYVSGTCQGLYVHYLFSRQTSHLLFCCSGDNSEDVVECYEGRDTRIKGKGDATCVRLGPWRNRSQGWIRNMRGLLEGAPARGSEQREGTGRDWDPIRSLRGAGTWVKEVLPCRFVLGTLQQSHRRAHTALSGRARSLTEQPRGL